jgi:hypothetical protein
MGQMHVSPFRGVVWLLSSPITAARPGAKVVHMRNGERQVYEFA